MRWKKQDGILIAAVLAVALLLMAWHSLSGNGQGAVVTVKVSGEVTASYSLSEDQTVSINGGTNTLTIRDGEAKMAAAECPDKLCVHQKAISKDGESIICLPNEVVVTVESQEESEFDTVAQ